MGKNSKLLAQPKDEVKENAVLHVTLREVINSMPQLNFLLTVKVEDKPTSLQFGMGMLEIVQALKPHLLRYNLATNKYREDSGLTAGLRAYTEKYGIEYPAMLPALSEYRQKYGASYPAPPRVELDAAGRAQYENDRAFLDAHKQEWDRLAQLKREFDEQDEGILKDPIEVHCGKLPLSALEREGIRLPAADLNVIRWLLDLDLESPLVNGKSVLVSQSRGQ